MSRPGRSPNKNNNARIDIKAVARACLDAAERLVPQWLPDGKKENAEWSATNPTRADHAPGSFKINLKSGKWADFAADEKGGDLVSLFAYLHGLEQGAAARELAAQLNMASPAARPVAGPPGAAESDWVFVEAGRAANAPPIPVAHIKRGAPQRVWDYRAAAGTLLGRVCRFETSDGGKDIVLLTLWRHAATGELKWRWAQFPEPRPLYGLDRLAAAPADAPVLVVEGEKCADAAFASIGERAAVVTWPGGGKATSKADFSPLAGRKVVLWADCDAAVVKTEAEAQRCGVAVGQIMPEAHQPGVRTMGAVAATLGKMGCKVRAVVIPKPGAVAHGWDVADAVAEGWDRARVWAALKSSAPYPSAGASGGRGADDPPPEFGAGEPPRSWRDELLWGDGRNARLLDCRENVYLFFKHHPALAGVVGFDQFAHQVAILKPPPWPHEAGTWPQKWTDDTDARAGYWLSKVQNDLRIKAEMTVKIGARMAALENSFHPVRDYLAALKWDGTARIDHWMIDTLGAPDTPYTRAVSRFSLIAMVARARQPGCWCRAVPVLIGPQNKGKSKAVRALAQPWNADTSFDVKSKDAFQMIQGVWGYEISEMDAFSRAEQTAVKLFISSPKDRCRLPYGREPVEMPRQGVFWGTSNTANFIMDATGGTRYWPVDVVPPYNVEGIAEMRDQLFAEAVAAYEAGERWWPEEEAMVEQFTEQQEQHTVAEPWLPIILHWLDDPDKGPPWHIVRHAGSEFDGQMIQRVEPHEVLLGALKFEASKLSATRQEMKRVEQCLTDLGCFKRKSGRKVGTKRPPVFVRVRPPDIHAAPEVDDGIAM